MIYNDSLYFPIFRDETVFLFLFGLFGYGQCPVGTEVYSAQLITTPTGYQIGIKQLLQ